MIKCLLIGVDGILIAEVVELDGNLISWPSIADQREIKIISDNVLTVVDPKPEIIKKYLELTS